MEDAAPEVLPIMLGTAGHVDHGKTSLVRQLTNWETDTHKEEQERGVTIDFGVAPFRVDPRRIAGIIDVPGHEDFIRNMVAGASAVDVLLLVVAADDGVMPQTREHMQIAQLLGVSRVMLVLSKSDLVDEETRMLALEECSEFLESLGYNDVPQFVVSSETGEGITQLREALVAAVETLPPVEKGKPFRMFVRKAFTMKGFGTVVTGVPLSGVAREAETLSMIPGDRAVVIRALQNYRAPVKQTAAHVSCAINVRDMAPSEFVRGMALVTPGSYRAKRSVLAYFENCSDIDCTPKKKDLLVRLHVGTAAVPAKFLGAVKAGESGFIRLATFKPLVIAANDTFVVRGLSESITLGGGRVLACRDVAKAHYPEAHAAPALEALQASDMLGAQLWTCDTALVSYQEIKEYVQLADEDIAAALKEKTSAKELLALNDSVYLFLPRLSELQARIADILKRYHRRNPEALGMKDQHLADLLSLPKNTFSKLWQVLQKSKEFRYENTFVALQSFAPSISKQEREQEAALLSLLERAENGHLAKGTVLEHLRMKEKDYRKLIKRMQESQQLAALGNSVISSNALKAIEAQMLKLFETNEVLDLKEFRTATGLSRNVAVEILEHFDARGLTKRLGGGRVLARKP